MLSYLGRFIVRIADLAEAEGRLARRELIRLGAAAMWSAAALMLGLIGLLVVGAGAYLALAMVTGPAAALSIVGAGLVGFGLVAYGLARGKVNRG